jgi:hypothetical protein
MVESNFSKQVLPQLYVSLSVKNLFFSAKMQRAGGISISVIRSAQLSTTESKNRNEDQIGLGAKYHKPNLLSAHNTNATRGILGKLIIP